MSGQSSSTFESGSQKYTIDRYGDKMSSSKRPVVVVFHGVDGMGGESGTEIRKLAEQIAGEGFLVFIPHYFDANDGADTLPLPELFERRVPRIASYSPRIAAAVDYALEQEDSDGGHLGLVGFSLGAGLMLGYTESMPACKVKAVVDYFGYISDTGIYGHADKLPPTLLLHNKKDQLVLLASSSQPLLDSLDKTRVVHDHAFYTDDNPARRNHPFLPGGHADVDARSRCVAWLKTHLKPSS